MLNKFMAKNPMSESNSPVSVVVEETVVVSETLPESVEVASESNPNPLILVEDDLHLMEDRTKEEIQKAEEEADLYNIKNFSL